MASPGFIPSVGPQESLFSGPIRTKLRDRLAQRLVDDAVAHGVPKAKATEAVEQLQGERPIIDFLLSVDWAKLVALVVQLAALL